VKIGYCKLSRAMPLSPAKWGVVGGDDEPPLLLKTLATRHPEHEWIIVGRNSLEQPHEVGLPANVTNPWTELMPLVKRDVAGRDQPQRITGDDLQHVIAVYDHYTRPLFEQLDGLIVWAGQHGTSNSPLPKIGTSYEDNDYTQPQKSFTLYASYILRGINAFRERDPLRYEEIWLVPDPRNYPKPRDLKWPQRLPILAQYEFTKNEKFERYRDSRTPTECGFDAQVDETGHVWNATQRYVYSGLEICGVLPEHIDSRFSTDWERREHFGLFINEARAYVKRNRLDAMMEYVVPLRPAFVHGKWSDKSKAQLELPENVGYAVEPAPAEVYYDKLRSVRCTLTTPSSGSGWATTKPWQAFAVGTVCFFHPDYDTQGHIIPTLRQALSGAVADEKLANLARWLRVTDPNELEKRVKYLNENRDAWLWLIRAQRALYDQACEKLLHVQLIEGRLGL
jgi:hypothetical protein